VVEWSPAGGSGGGPIGLVFWVRRRSLWTHTCTPGSDPGPPRVDLYAGRPRQVPLVVVAVVGVAQTPAPYGIWVRRDSSRALL